MPDYVSFRTTDAVADGNGSFLKAQRCSPGHRYHILYILVDTHRIVIVGIRCLWLQWSGVGVGGRMLMSLFLDYRPKAWLLGPITVLLVVLWNSPIVFHHGCTDLHSHHRCQRAFFPPCSLFIGCIMTSHRSFGFYFLTNEAGRFSHTWWSLVHILQKNVLTIFHQNTCLWSTWVLIYFRFEIFIIHILRNSVGCFSIFLKVSTVQRLNTLPLLWFWLFGAWVFEVKPWPVSWRHTTLGSIYGFKFHPLRRVPFRLG